MTPDEARAAPMTPDEAWAALRAGKIDAATFFAAAYPNGLRGDSAPIIPKPEEVALKASTPNAIGAPKPTQATPAERADWWVREEPKRREVALTDAIAERILLEPTAAGQEEQKQRLGRIERSGAPAGLREAVGRVMERQTMGGMAAEAQLSKTGAAAKPTFAEVAAPVAHQAPIAASLVGVPPQAEKAGWSLTGLADAATAKLGGAVELGRKALVAADATGGRGPADVTRVFDNLARNHPTLLAALQTAAPALAVIEDLNRVAATAAAEKEPGRTLHGTAPLESATGAALRRLTTPGSLVAEAGWSGAEQMPLTELKVGGKSVYLPGMWGAGVRAGSAALDAAGLKTPWDGLVSVGPTTGLAAPDLAAARGVDD
ncbi:MAG TPA: hypothetical protein VEB59_10835, partial [Gemmatimonadales bacterium]|nr:hypothetical protein [Gemmatimonadales bacterium]